MINFQQFYLHSGIRLVDNLAVPKFHNLSELKLPRDSIIHYCDYEGILLGPNNNDPLFNGFTKQIQISHEMDLTSQLGFPRKIPYIPNEDIRNYHNQNRHTRWLKQLEGALRDPETLIVKNYSFLLKNYKYTKSFFTDYYKWYNIFSTMLETINSINSSTMYKKNHFINVAAPKIIPGINKLNYAMSRNISQDILKIFRDTDSYLLLEIWKWLSDDKEIKSKSLISKIPIDKLNSVNLLFIESGSWVVLNLAYLLSFSKESKNIKEIEYLSRIKINSLQLQKRFLRLEVSVFDQKSISIARDNNINLDEVIEQDIKENLDLIESVLPEAKVDKEKEEIIKQTISSVDLDLADDEDEDLIAKKIEEEDLKLDDELAYLNEITNIQNGEDNKPTKTLNQFLNDLTPPTYEQGIMAVANRMADDNLLSAPAYRHCTDLSVAHKNITMANGENMFEFSKINPEDLKLNDKPNITDKDTVIDKSMLKSTLLEFDSRYIEKILPKDIIKAVFSVHNAGVAVVDYKIEPVTDILNEFETHIVKLQPVIGKQSTIRFKIPIIKPNGIYLSNGVKYRMRKQRGDLPIRKISDNLVALTSYYGKIFVTRGRKKADDYGHWLVSQITAKVLNKEDNLISNLLNSNVFDSNAKVPRAYSSIAKSIKNLSCRGFDLNFDYKSRFNLYGEEAIKTFEKYGNVIIGVNKQNNYLLLDENNTVYITKGEDVTVFSTIEHFLGLNVLNSPIEFAEVSVYGKDVPVGIVLSYFLGFSNLLKILKLNPRRVLTGTRLNLAVDEWAMQFIDETLIFSKEDRYSNMILAGFNDANYRKAISKFSIYSFDKKSVYLNLLEASGLSVRYLREMDLQNKMFVDHITEAILIEMKEPITYQGLLFRSCELLLDDRHPDALDPKFMRIKGYERIAGAIYNELVQAIKVHEGKLGKSTQPIDMNPYAVWKRISEDPSKALVNEINPIESLKEIEAVTFSGTGGRSRRSMTKTTRIYHPNDLGTISESTVDNSDVGINIFTTADPQFTSLRGISKQFDKNKTSKTSILSTSALLSVASTNDDPKRVNFIGIQNSHSIATEGYHQFTTRTGYDSVIADRTYDLFAHIAKKPGVVKSIDNDGIVIEYDDGTTEGYELGRRFGASAGLTIPHYIKTTLKQNDRVEIGDAVIYNSGFFEPDFFNPKTLAFKNSINVKTVLWESYQTLEDSSAISKRVSDKLTTSITKVKNIIVTFDQTISRLVKVGQEVNADDMLCVIEDPVTSNNSLFSDDSIDTLRILSAQTPKANVKGVIERIEVFYHGDKEDMSESLRQIADESDKIFKKKSKSVAKDPTNGSVDSGLRIDNEPLALDNMVIKIYITYKVGAYLGDKGVFGNQMKTVFGEVFEKDYITEDGEIIDCIFSNQSINDRNVLSPYIIGTTNVLLELIATGAVELYNN